MSGTPIMLKPLPISVTEMAYGMIMKELGLENASVQDRIRRLVTISPDELVAKTPMTVPLVPFLDGDVICSATTFKKLEEGADAAVPGRQWCTELMVGDCKHDVCPDFTLSTSIFADIEFRAQYTLSWESRPAKLV
jgi:hypothetical protein